MVLLATLTWPLSLGGRPSLGSARPAAARDVVVVVNDSELNQSLGLAAKTGLENFKLGYPCGVGCFVTATWNAHQWAWR